MYRDAFHRLQLGIQASHQRGEGRFPDRLCDALGVELFGTLQLGAPPSWPESLFGQAAQGGSEMHCAGWQKGLKHMGVQVETVALRDREPVQVSDAEYEWAGPVGQPAGCGAQRFAGLEESGIYLGGNRIAQYRAERATHHIGALTQGKVHLV